MPIDHRGNTVEFDTDRLDRLREELDACLYRVTSTPVEVDAGSGRALHNDPNKAEVSRTLLRAADLADLISAEVKMLYWAMKGQDDPRDDERG